MFSNVDIYQRNTKSIQMLLSIVLKFSEKSLFIWTNLIACSADR